MRNLATLARLRPGRVVTAAIGTVLIVLTSLLSWFELSSAFDGKREEIDRTIDASITTHNLQKALDRVAANGAHGVVASVEWQGGHWEGHAGKASQSEQTFRAGSITKELVAVAILRLSDRGEFKLDTRVQRLLPDLWPEHSDVTIRQLLNHTSGVPDYFEILLSRPKTPAQFVDVFSPHRSDKELVRIAGDGTWIVPAGTKWNYSNTGYVALGMIAARVNGKPIGRILQEEVIEPAGLSHTRLAVRSSPLPVLREKAVVGSKRFDIDWFNPSNLSSAGALVTTPADLNRFHRALSNGSLLSQKMVRTMRAAQPLQPAYGVGTVILPDSCDREHGKVYGHDGATLGTQALSFASADGKRRVTIAATGLADSGPGPESLKKFLELALHSSC